MEGGDRCADRDFEEGPEWAGFDEEPHWQQPPEAWPQALADLFVPLGPHTAADGFIDNAPTAPLWRTLLCNALSYLPVDDFDAKAWLRMGPVHLFTTRQLQGLFAFAGVQKPFSRALDIGAGEGHVTAQIRPLCETLVACETSSACARRLRRQGLAVWREDVAETAAARAAAGEGEFSLVSMLNVLDRCAQPRRLLRSAAALLRGGGGGTGSGAIDGANRDLSSSAEGGWLLLATPLPFRGSFYGWRNRWNGRPLEDLGLEQTNLSTEEVEAAWSRHAQQLLEQVLPELGFAPKAISRLPYLSAADALDPVLELDDLVVVAQRI